jgi:hypothetical protein
MELRNTTPFPALAFQGVDQYAQRFHVVALRQTLVWDAQGQLSYAPMQTPLCVADQYFDSQTTPGKSPGRKSAPFQTTASKCARSSSALMPPNRSCPQNPKA